MENPSKITKKFDKIVGGELRAHEDRNIEIPAKTAITMSTDSMFLNGEMSISLEQHTAIKDAQETVARISNDDKMVRILTSRKLAKEESEKAVDKYMKEKGIKSIEDIIVEGKNDKEEIVREDRGI